MADHQVCKASAPKYALGLNSWTPLLETLFSIYKPSKFDLVADVNKTCSPLRRFDGRIRPLGGRIFTKQKCWNWQQMRWSNPRIRWPNSSLQNSYFLPFCGLQLHESQWI